jgi:TonB family protein
MVARLIVGRGVLVLTAACLISEGQTLVIKKPRIVAQKVEPVFTREALKARSIGNGAVDVWVDRNGTPVEVRLVSWTNVNTDSPDWLGLDKAAMTAIRHWRFAPLIVDGKPTPFHVRIGALLHPTGSTFTISDPEPISN